ncbi:MAG: hypothetical protein WC006_02085 [Bacilli bacterium]
MYYCNSRYYVPEWCRWLNAGDISCLDKKVLMFKRALQIWRAL